MSAAGSNPAPSAEPAGRHAFGVPPRVGCNRVVPSSSYRFSSPFVVRLIGSALVVLGLLVVLLVLLAVLLSLPGVVPLTILGVAFVGVLALALVAGRRPVVVAFDETGYRIRFVRGAGVRRAEWRQVEDVTTTTAAGERCVVLRLRDGRTSTVPVGVLAGRTEDFVEDLRSHLNRGHGYRTVRGRA
jgi:hypothetical protein